MSLAFAVAGLSMPSLAGFWFEATGSYTGAFLIASPSAFVGAGCVATAARLA